MLEKRHSCVLGTCLAGFSAASLRINAPRFWMNWSSTTSAGMRTVFDTRKLAVPCGAEAVGRLAGCNLIERK